MTDDPTRMCELLIGLGDVNVLAVNATGGGLEVSIETRGPRPTCHGCGGGVRVNDRDVVRLVDLPCFGRQAALS